MALARGRAASPIRPGFIIKNTLLGRLPLVTGELIREAAISDLFGAYKGELERVNSLRPKINRIRGMRYRSFYTLFKFAQLLRLVTYVREEPMLFPPPTGNLYRVERVEEVLRIKISTRKVFRISDVGTEDERSWSDLRRAWMEGWEAPQPYVAPVPLPPPPIEVRPPPPPPVTFTPYVWVEKPSKARFKSLHKHLLVLGSLEPVVVKDELERLSMLVGDWMIEIEDDVDRAEEAGREEVAEKLMGWHEVLQGVSEALGELDAAGAAELLGELV